MLSLISASFDLFNSIANVGANVIIWPSDIVVFLVFTYLILGFIHFVYAIIEDMSLYEASMWFIFWLPFRVYLWLRKKP